MSNLRFGIGSTEAPVLAPLAREKRREKFSLLYAHVTH